MRFAGLSEYNNGEAGSPHMRQCNVLICALLDNAKWMYTIMLDNSEIVEGADRGTLFFMTFEISCAEESVLNVP